MTEKRDYYEVLGISRNATSQDIKKVYRKLARQFHPDTLRNPSELEKKEAEERFKEISEAYEILRDEDKRMRYDRFGHAGVSGTGAGSGSPFGDIFGFGDLFRSFFGGGTESTSRGRAGPSKGQDVRYDIEITFEAAAEGLEDHEIVVPMSAMCATCTGSGAAPGTDPETCSTCNGAGEVRTVQRMAFGQFVNVATCPRCRGRGHFIKKKCSTCDGTGTVVRDKRTRITIPKGVESGMRLRVREAGRPGEFGGPPGDLFVVIHIKEHPFFERHGDDLVCEVPITFSQATLGAKVDIPTIDGRNTTISSPAGTQSGEIKTIRNKGMPHLRSGGRGDLHVRYQLKTPERLTRDQKELFRKMADLEGTEPQKSFFERIKEQVKKATKGE